MTRTLRKLVFVEPKSTHLHIYSRVCIPRLRLGPPCDDHAGQRV